MGSTTLLARLWKNGTLEKLMDAGLLAAMEPTRLEGRRYRFALRLTHTPAISFGYEWCGEMWRDAALAVIDLMKTLANDALTLRQPNPWYVLFDGPMPVYVNPGSIALFDGTAWSGAVERLVRGFLYPLHFCSNGQGQLARTLQRSLYGIRHDDFEELHAMEKRMLRDGAESDSQDFLTRLRGYVEEIEIPETCRSSQHSSEPPLKPCERWGQMHWAVHRTLKTLRPRTVLVLPCGGGWSARLAALEGAEVIAADPDEGRVSRIYQQALQERGHVLPLVLDLVDPSPGIGMANRWLPPANERLQSDLLVALGTMHHLMMSGLRLSFDQVVEGFSALTRRWLLVEFVPFGSKANPYDKNSRPDCSSWYDLDHFMRALGRRFRTLSVVSSASEETSLVLCER